MARAWVASNGAGTWAVIRHMSHHDGALLAAIIRKVRLCGDRDDIRTESVAPLFRKGVELARQQAGVERPLDFFNPSVMEIMEDSRFNPGPIVNGHDDIPRAQLCRRCELQRSGKPISILNELSGFREAARGPPGFFPIVFRAF